MELRTHTRSALLTGALAVALVSSPVVALAADAGSNDTDPVDIEHIVKTVEYGASWDYGSIPLVYGWSNLTSSTRWHSSTVTATGASDTSGPTSPGVTSNASLWDKWPTFNAYYNIW